MDTEPAALIVAHPPSQDQEALFQKIDTYPWATEKDFQDGLRHILPAAKDAAHAEHLTLRARCFYYCRYVLSCSQYPPLPVLSCRSPLISPDLCA